MSDFTLVNCTARDCMYYREYADDRQKCECTHTDKSEYMENIRCPLYRMDWQKQLRSAGMKKGSSKVVDEMRRPIRRRR